MWFLTNRGHGLYSADQLCALSAGPPPPPTTLGDDWLYAQGHASSFCSEDCSLLLLSREIRTYTRKMPELPNGLCVKGMAKLKLPPHIVADFIFDFTRAPLPTLASRARLSLGGNPL